MDIIKNAKLLYDTLLSNRESLPEVLSKFDDYQILREIIEEIEKKSETTDIWRRLCLGLEGEENNKLSAIYEIPTKQLITVLSNLFQMCDIKRVDEVGAGLGLLTKQLEKNNKDIQFIASDDNSDETTSIELDYVKIRKKAILDIIFQIDKDLEPPDAVIVSWPSNKDMTYELEKLVKINKVKLIVIINKILDKLDVIHAAVNAGYQIKKLPILQISYLDYYDKNVLDIKSQGITTVLVHESVNFNINTSGKEFYKYFDIDKERLVAQDMVLLNKIPIWSCVQESLSDVRFVINMHASIKNNSRFTQKDIPQWIPNIELLNFWYNKKNVMHFPKNINSTDTLIKYYNLVKDLDNNKIQSLKDDNIIPEWINSIMDAETYIWTMFSVSDDDTDDEWKTNQKKFAEKFDFLFGNSISISSLLDNYIPLPTN